MKMKIKKAFSLSFHMRFSVLTEVALGHLRYHLTDVPPLPNSPPDTVFDSDQPSERALNQEGKLIE